MLKYVKLKPNEMEIEIHCSNCKEKTPHKPINIITDKWDNGSIKWLCNKCENGYHQGELIFESKNEHTITKDRKTKEFLINRLRRNH